MKSYKDVFKDKRAVLFVVAHPDDLDVFFGGLVALLRKDKKNVVILLATSGERGSKDNEISESDLSDQRLQEQSAALMHLDVPEKNLFRLDYLDGEVESDKKLIGKVVRYIRQIKPDIVCTHEPHGFYYDFLDTGAHYVNHRDHRKVGEAVMDAVYPFSRDRSFFTEHYTGGIEPHSVFELLFTPDHGFNTQININDILEQKRNALSSHKSQFTTKIVDDILEERSENGVHFERFNHIRLLW